jgi:hypothetical protein
VRVDFDVINGNGSDELEYRVSHPKAVSVATLVAALEVMNSQETSPDSSTTLVGRPVVV